MTDTAVTAIKTGEYSALASGWASQASINVNNAEESATSWATESNAAVCTTVLARGISYVGNNDLSGSYTDTASPTVRLQIAKQGYRCVLTNLRDVDLNNSEQLIMWCRRLAKWLDAIVAAT